VAKDTVDSFFFEGADEDLGAFQDGRVGSAVEGEDAESGDRTEGVGIRRRGPDEEKSIARRHRAGETPDSSEMHAVSASAGGGHEGPAMRIAYTTASEGDAR